MSPSSPKKQIFTGTFIHVPSLSTGISVLENAVVGVDERGVIAFIERDVEALYEDTVSEGLTVAMRDVLVVNGWEGLDVEVVESGRDGMGWWGPGFVDTHTHASQLPNTGLFGATTLLNWLKTYTFPLESRYSSLSHARRVYNSAVTSTLSHGTTTCAYYATIHPESTNLLADICLEKGQRAFVGKATLEDTKAVVQHIISKDPRGELVQPIITPRFAPSCTKEALSALGQLAEDESLPIQTHISENKGELALVRQMFPNSTSYADIYDSFHLLTPRTILAHAIHLDQTEMELIKRRGSGISHCPLSNTSLGSGICPVRRLLDHGINVGLGTDVSGGGSCSILTAAREASGVSRLLSNFEQGNGKSEEESERMKLSVAECLFLATRGGATCLGLEKRVGAFEVGMEWDAQLIRLESVPEEGGVDDGEDERMDEGIVYCWGNESWEEKVAKWMYCGDDRNTRKVYVKGRLVHERS
ncbi:MAG: hypothetical protein Q9192_001268 [Flavoplaca navasiana]